MNGIHDVGGMHGFGAVQWEADEPVFHAAWEGRVFALLMAASDHLDYPPGGFRYAIERLPPEEYLRAGYYERWLTAIEAGLLGSGAIGREELRARTAVYEADPAAPVPRRDDPERAAAILEELAAVQSPHRETGAAPRFAVGAVVRARRVHPVGHTRLPRYVRGSRGVVTRVQGIHAVQDTSTAGMAPKSSAQAVYAVRFPAAGLWGADGGGNEAVVVDLWEDHLEPADGVGDGSTIGNAAVGSAAGRGAAAGDAAAAGGGVGAARAAVPSAEAPPTGTASPAAPAVRARALEALLVEKGLVSSDTLDAVVCRYEAEVGPRYGAQVVARAWVDAGYKQWLLEQGTAAMASLGFGGEQGAEMVVVENTAAVHNVVVCTLCSCYPWPVLGLPPRWYKSLAYRSRMVMEPRAVLRELGLVLDESVEVRVWDSTSEVRYLVLPERPAGTAGLSEQELAALVRRDAMIGVSKVALPEPRRS